MSSSVTVNGVRHTVFTIEANTELQALVGKGIKSGDRTPATDQIGKIRPNLLTIGAIEGAPVEPITISCDVDTVQVTQGYSADVAVSADLADDYQGWPLSWTLSPDVSGITISNDGVLTVADSVPVGSYSIDIVATITSGDETYSDNKTIRVTVYPYPVIVISEDSSSGTAGSMFTQALTAKATVNSADASVTPSWSISGDLPSGITFSSGTFSGIPTVSGDYTFTVKVSADVTTIDSHDITISQDKQFTISLAAATVTIYGTPSDGTVGQSYSAVTFSAAPDTLSYTWSATGLPRGLTLSGDTLSGTPTKSGPYNAKIIAVSPGGIGSQDITIVINSSGLASYPQTPNGSKDIYLNQNDSSSGESYSGSFSTFNEVEYSNGTQTAGLIIASVGVKIITKADELSGISGYNFSEPVKFKVEITQNEEYHYTSYDLVVSVDNLPEGFTVSGDTSFDNVPIDSQDLTIYITGFSNSNFTQEDIVISAFVTVSGDDPVLMNSADHTIKITIAPVVLTSMTLAVTEQELVNTFTEKTAASINLSSIVTDVTGYFSDSTNRSAMSESSITFSSSSLPEGFSIAGSALNISESAAAGSYDITITAAAANGSISASNTKTLRVIIEQSAQAVSINTTQLPAGQVGKSYSFDIDVTTTPEDLAYTLNASGLPRGLTLTDNLLAGTPAKSGSYPVKITADSAGGTDFKDFTLVINPSGVPIYPEGTTGSKESAQNQIDAQTGGRYSRSKSRFTEPFDGSGAAGVIIASVDIKILTESDELRGTTGEDFSAPVKISVSIAKNSEYRYNSYSLSVSAENLPEGFSIDGGTENIPVDQQETTIYITGLSDTSFTREGVVISALVTVLGDDPELLTSAAHTVKIAVLSDVLTSINISMDSQAVSGKFTEGFAASMDLSGATADVTGSFIDGTSRSVKAESEIAFSSTSLPEGFSIESSALRIAEYAAAGTYTIPVTVTAKNRGLSASRTENISVIIAPYPTLEIATTEIASGKIGEEFSASLSASATVNGEETSIAPVWTLVDGVLPAGLALSSDGVIYGVPEESGAFDFAVQASAEVMTVDGHNIALSADKVFALLIANAKGELPHDVDIVSCEVRLAGSSELTLTEGTSGSVTLTPEVTAAYSDGSARLLAADEYSVSWTINTAFLAAYGMSFSNGTLTISETTPADTYNIAVGVNISAVSLTAEAGAYFTVTVNPRESQPGTSTPDQQSNRDVVINVEGDSVALVVKKNAGSSAETSPAKTFSELVGNLSQTEKELITDIDLSQNAAITDLTGLAEFKNVSSINGNGCGNLSAVDVSGCNNLEYLDVSSCDIGSLSVEGCEALRELVCSNNSIETLDLSSCPNLEVLDCKNNNLSVLNVEANNLLTKIDCRYNGLSALDITESIFAALNELRCEGQQIFGIEAALSGGVYRIDINALSRITGSISGFLAGAVTSDKVYNVKAYDENGQEIRVTYDSQTGIFESPAKPDTVKYDYVTGYKGVDMDVTLNAAYSPEVLGGTLGSRGGCNASFGCLALLSMVLLLRKR